MMKNRNFLRRALCLVVAVATAIVITACSPNSTTAVSSSPSAAPSGGAKIVNIAVTDTLGSLNPLTIDATEINKYATAMGFLPLVELDGSMAFAPALADSVTTTDNTTFTIKLNKDATWSDGQPVTADDVAFTITRLCSPVIANATMALSALEGTGDDGFVAKDATTVTGITIIDSKTLTLKMKHPMALMTFDNSYARYIMTVPKHILSSVAESDLANYDWFNHPAVVDGPYIATAVDTDHYVSYKANDKYWKGVPKIALMNIKIVSPSAIYSGLKSGEIDFVQQTMGDVPQEDYANIEKLANVKVTYGQPVTTQSLFFNTANITDVRIRQAILLGIDRQLLLKNLLNGRGEVDDAFLTSVSPYYDKSLTPTPYDPSKAKELVKEAGWDSSKTLDFYINSGDSTFVNAASVIKEELSQIGINVAIHTVDLATLMSTAGSGKYDMLDVQYTYAPVDPYPDVSWLLSGTGSWTNFSSDDINKALANTQDTTSADTVHAQYLAIDKAVQQQVPMINVYVIKALGANSTRLQNATPGVFGSFINIQDWTLQ